MPSGLGNTYVVSCGQQTKFLLFKNCVTSVGKILQYYHDYAILGFAIITIASIVNIVYPVYCCKLLNINM